MSSGTFVSSFLSEGAPIGAVFEICDSERFQATKRGGGICPALAVTSCNPTCIFIVLIVIPMRNVTNRDPISSVIESDIGGYLFV